jgi:hypothetical protein
MTIPTKILHSTTPGNKPSSLLSGQLAINEADRALYYLDPTLAAPSSLLDQVGLLTAHSNLMINGGMEVDQVRNGALQSAVTTGSYLVDMVKLITSGAQVLSAQQIADAPAGFFKSLKVSVTTANASPGASDFCCFAFPIEGRNIARLGFGAVGALNVAIGFYVKAFRAGTYVINIANAANNRGYSTTFVIAASATWQWVSVTIPGDITGTWATDNTNGMTLSICMMAGSSMQAVANAWSTGGQQGVAGMANGCASTSDFMQLTGVCLFPGYVMPTAVRAPVLLPRFADALALCSRYWQKSYDYETLPAAVTQIGAHGFTYNLPGTQTWTTTMEVRLPVSMRADPTVVSFSTATGSTGVVRDLTNSADVSAGISLIGQKGFMCTATLSVASTAVSFIFQWTVDARL